MRVEVKMELTISSSASTKGAMAFFAFFTSSFLLPLVCAQLQQQPPRTQSRSPHGLVYENPVAFPPAAFDFFHPNARPAHSAAPLPLVGGFPEIASKARADPVYTWPAPPHGGGIGAAGAAAAVIGGIFIVAAAVAGVSYVVIRRRSNPEKGGGGDRVALADA